MAILLLDLVVEPKPIFSEVSINIKIQKENEAPWLTVLSIKDFFFHYLWVNGVTLQGWLMTLRRNWWRVKQKHKSTSPYPKSLTKCFITTGSNTEELIYQSLLYHCDLSSIFFFIQKIFSSVIIACAQKLHIIQWRRTLMRVSIFVRSWNKSINQVQGQTNNLLCNHARAAL